MKNKYKFSVIIPVYNVEQYISETIESVINQTIGFEKNIEIIIVNDGSPDNSDIICQRYQEKYPQNIKYIEKENGGVSSARNLGIKHINGKYVNFLDSDDKWELDAFEKAYNFFEEHYEEIDIVACIIEFFEARTGKMHSLNYKFIKDQVVDIFNFYNYPQLSSSSCFFKAEAIGKIRFDEKLKISEDSKFLSEILLRLEKIGYLASTTYFYRKRFNETSAIQNMTQSLSWYIDTPELCYKYIFDLSIKKYGYVIPYIQFLVTYDYQWRIKDDNVSIFNPDIKEKYLSITKELFQNIEDYIILEQKKINIEYKIKLLCLKYNKDITKEFKYINGSLYFKGNKVLQLNNRSLMNIKTINYMKDKIEVRGLLNIPLNLNVYKIYAIVNNQKILINHKNTSIYNRKFFGESFITDRGFVLEIPTKNFESLSFEILYDNHYNTTMNFNLGMNSKLSIKAKNYYINGNKIYYYYNNKIKVRPKNIKNKLRFILRYYKNLVKNKQFKVLIYRILYSIVKIFKHKKIWLISDRPSAATDNGLHMFKYVNKIKDKDIKPYFVITKDSKDYKMLKKIGKTIIYNSLKYKIYFLLADKIISSQADEWTTNAFGTKEIYYRDIYNADFIFLQHGIIKDDLSVWLNCYEKNIKFFVTSAIDEYNSVINGEYGYNKDIVKLTGLPRYDNLQDKKEKIIAITPTWRKSIAEKQDAKTGLRKYSENFINTDYYKFYNSLINDNKLIETMKKNGYKGIFVVHPSHVANGEDFKGNETFEVVSGIADYQKIFKESALLVSDYSSLPFDFAYLNKPVIYTQFDKKEFFSSHSYTEGYFSYEKNGFGPVLYNYDDTVKEIIKFLENDCKLEKKYQERINKFYKYHDQDNCKRVYEGIKKI